MTVLNIGCGLDYRAGAVNLDLYDLCVADVQGDAWRLPVADNSLTKIAANHLLEHLGYAGAIFALAEWYRVMKPGGTLTVETPERSEACRALVQETPPTDAFHWAFGLPHAGYSHRTLFGPGDLREVVERAGFLVESITQDEASQTVLLVRSSKSSDRVSSLRARLHRSFVAAGIIEPATVPAYLAHLETVCDVVVSNAQVHPVDGAQAMLIRVLGAAARFDPRIASATMRSLVDCGLVQIQGAAPFLELCLTLEGMDLPARLAAATRRIRSLPGSQASRLQQITSRFDLYLTAKLYPQEVTLEPARDWLEGGLDQPSRDDLEIEFFCAETLHLAGRKATALGQRAFARGQRRRAHGYFERAVTYDADNPLPWWNLARLSVIDGRTLEALEYYAGALEIAPGLASVLQPEMDAVTERSLRHDDRFTEPVGKFAISQGDVPAGRVGMTAT